MYRLPAPSYPNIKTQEVYNTSSWGYNTSHLQQPRQQTFQKIYIAVRKVPSYLAVIPLGKNTRSELFPFLSCHKADAPIGSQTPDNRSMLEGMYNRVRQYYFSRKTTACVVHLVPYTRHLKALHETEHYPVRSRPHWKQ